MPSSLVLTPGMSLGFTNRYSPVSAEFIFRTVRVTEEVATLAAVTIGTVIFFIGIGIS